MSLPEPRGGAPSDCLLAEVWSTQRSDVKPIQCARLKHAATRRSLPWTKNCNSTSCFVSCFSFFFIVFTFVTRLSWLSTDLDFGVDETLVFLYYRSQEVSRLFMTSVRVTKHFAGGLSSQCWNVYRQCIYIRLLLFETRAWLCEI